MKVARISSCVVLLSVFLLAACSKEPTAPGVYTLSGHVKLTGFLVDTSGNFAGTEVVGNADGVPVELVYGTQVVGRVLTVGGVYRFSGVRPGGYITRTSEGPLYDETLPLTVVRNDLPAADTLRLVAQGALYPVPNPIGIYTMIYYYLSDTEQVEMHVEDLAGDLVRHVVPGHTFQSGLCVAGWDGTDDAGHRASASMFWVVFHGENPRDTLGLVDERLQLLFR